MTPDAQAESPISALDWKALLPAPALKPAPVLSGIASRVRQGLRSAAPGFPPPNPSPSPPGPSTAGLLDACARFITLEHARWTRRDANGDIDNSHYDGIETQQIALLATICHPMALRTARSRSGRAACQAARVRCFEAIHDWTMDDQICAKGRCLLRSILQDTETA